MAVANAHSNGASPFRRPDYINKFVTLTEGIIDKSEQDRFLELVQHLPSLSPEELMSLNPVATAGYLVENLAKGIF